MSSKCRLLLYLLFVSVIFTQCKSVEFTFLGLVHKKYETAKQPTVEIKNEVKQGEPVLYKDSVLSISGIVTDSLTNPLANVEIFLLKETTVEYHVVTGADGNYLIDNVNPDTYNFYLVIPQKKNQNKTFNNITVKQENKQINFRF